MFSLLLTTVVFDFCMCMLNANRDAGVLTQYRLCYAYKKGDILLSVNRRYQTYLPCGTTVKDLTNAGPTLLYAIIV